jgi:oligopeptide/dipeptide ABC transporter ATP-binding protein
MQPLLEIRAVRKYYSGNGRQVRAVDGVSLDVYPGEALGLVGESGCGKSTLARCAVGLTETTSGSVRFDGADMARMTARELRSRRREFQIVFQDPSASLDPRRTVEDALLEPFRAHGLGTSSERERWVAALLEDVALDPTILGCYPTQLSGGQQQRIALARALALKPRLLVADEPVSALDASVAAQILNLLSDTRGRTGVTLLFVSHSLPAVRYLCDRVAVMYLGRIVEESAAEPFFAGPRHPYSRLLLRSAPGSGAAIDQNGKVFMPEAAASERSFSGCAFEPRCVHRQARCAREQPQLEVEPGGGKVSCFFSSYKTQT